MPNTPRVSLSKVHPRGSLREIHFQRFTPRGSLPGVHSQMLTPRCSLPDFHSQMFTPRGSLPEVHSQRFTPRGSGETLWWWNHFCQRNVFLGLELRARPVVTCKRGKVGGGDGGEWKEHGSYVLSCMMNEYVGDKKQWTTNYPTSFFTQILAR